MKDLLGILIGSSAAILMVRLLSALGEQLFAASGVDVALAVRWGFTLIGAIIALLGFVHPVLLYMGARHRLAGDVP